MSIRAMPARIRCARDDPEWIATSHRDNPNESGTLPFTSRFLAVVPQSSKGAPAGSRAACESGVFDTLTLSDEADQGKSQFRHR